MKLGSVHVRFSLRSWEAPSPVLPPGFASSPCGPGQQGTVLTSSSPCLADWCCVDRDAVRLGQHRVALGFRL